MSALRSTLFSCALGLALLGMVMVYSATYRDYGAHYLLVRGLHLALGLGVFVLASRVRYTQWRSVTQYLYFAVLGLLVLVLVPGIGSAVGGARRWIDLGFMSLQPSEFAKLAAVLVLACALARLPAGSGLPYRTLAAVGVLVGLILLQPDFGTSVVLVCGAAGALWASEVRTGDLLAAGGLGVVALVLVMLVEPYRRDRFMTFLDPWSVSDGSGYQVVQALIAIKAGNAFGSGAGGGAESAAIPEVQTDMIFALIGEELGLFGMVVVILAFCALVVCGYRIALEAPTVMSRCLAAGLTTMFAAQAVFNMGAVMVVLPLAGITLPFISYGGSSLIVCFAAVGILYRISADSERARAVKPARSGKPSRARSGGPTGRAKRKRLYKRSVNDKGGRRTGTGGNSGRRDRGTRDPRPLRG
ncbi:Bacterial cell division membrane protein [Rubrobacter radiotolerans]|uniref:Probable peptidoglycan glycosyltransferase FtsW n=1 Tax=Rubrobacter radiotolerans TaxID=42256 RepID=A0A023X400_RUBRA|nr:putative peptidoglycan glycosyltransferase FtsW [Rubrobacter radiotolerans]AHY46784.1 Bacterial cell division membrane protein [Rubrobacter radiotolerans]MDX5894191.1 putative peptidoglycan glycosyltransferase FtsW [Rubrobacter radiotolerans]SMC05442.1 cell division protein FtsW [Rubrobacter radiotolerans DSM 5868]